MRTGSTRTIVVAIVLAASVPAFAGRAEQVPDSSDRLTHGESARSHADSSPPPPEFEPSLPEGSTLDEVLDYSAGPPPEDYPRTLHDDRLYAFTLVEQFEYRVATDETSDQLGWEAQGWVGGDFNRFWWKNEGEAAFEGSDEGETETDLLYSRLITPFWNFQVGAQYANSWGSSDYDDRWSGVIALQGLAPYKFELDQSLYISEDGDGTLDIEAEYHVRLSQRLVLQPRTEIGFAFQDIPSRDLGAGMTDVILDLRLRYEIKREFAPYLGLRYRFLVGQTEDIADAGGEDSQTLLFMLGVRFAF